MMMPQEAATSSALSAWESFYVIVGSSGAALTGLQFVVIALVHDIRAPTSSDTIGAFGTPTVVHFSVALLVAATLSAPWPTLTGPDLVLGATGLGGLAYSALIFRRAARQTGYRPVFEDWLWHIGLPGLAYLVLLVAALVLRLHVTGALFAVGAASLLLLFVGIHNAWDTVTYLTTTSPESSTSPEAPARAAEPSLTGSLRGP
jgi:hypothetical protein